MSLPKSSFVHFLIFIVFAASPLFLSCDKGVAPFPESSSGETGFEGEVSFYGNWPDSVLQTYLVVFKLPYNSAAEFLPPNLSYIIGPIEIGSTKYVYNSIDNRYSPNFTLTPGAYNYVVILQSKKPTLTLNWNDWTVAGIYYSANDITKPGRLIIEDGRITKNINITCDFGNLHIQSPQKIAGKNE